jgi:hypothetical protein
MNAYFFGGTLTLGRESRRQKERLPLGLARAPVFQK